MVANTASFHQELKVATQHLEALRAQTRVLPDQQGTPHPALGGLAAALLALQQAYDDLARQNEICSGRCRDLERERAYYRDLFEHVPHARFLTDLSSPIQAANATAFTLLLASEGSLVGQPLAALLSEPDRRAFSLRLAQLRAGGALQG